MSSASNHVMYASDIGLDPQRIQILSEQGRARIEAENAAKEAKRNEKQEKGLQPKGWNGTLKQQLERAKGMVRSKNLEDGDGKGVIR
ncbi:hypothetical protein MMC22_003911 [Lobaria immixta]|nr:hypothetical protein [Lobaria immixta]